MQTDKELYISFLGGNHDAFEQLVIRYRTQLTYFLVQYTHNTDNAEDIAQDVFAYIFIKPERFDLKYEFKTYLFTIAKRRAIDLLRKEKNIPISLDDVEIQEEKELEDAVVLKEDVKKLRSSIKKLKKEYRIVIILTEFYDMSINDVSEILQKSPTATKVLAHRARNALKKLMLDERGE